MLARQQWGKHGHAHCPLRLTKCVPTETPLEPHGSPQTHVTPALCRRGHTAPGLLRLDPFPNSTLTCPCLPTQPPASGSAALDALGQPPLGVPGLTPS